MHLQRAVSVGTLAMASWLCRTPVQSFLQVHSGFRHVPGHVPVLGRPRFALLQLQRCNCLRCNVHKPTRSLTFSLDSKNSEIRSGCGKNYALRAGCQTCNEKEQLANWCPEGTLAAGKNHTCAVRTDGRLVCFGDDRAGQCNVPADLGPILAVAAHTQRTCAVRADGRLVCFGRNL